MNKYNELIQAYFGLYQDNIYAVSTDKKLIKLYFEELRGLNKTDYQIEKRNIFQSDLLLRYDDQYLVDWNGYFIPNIDTSIISIENKSIDTELMDTIRNLKHIILLTQDINAVSSKEKYKLLDALNTLNKIKKSSKITQKMEKTNSIEYSILYISMDEYIHHLNSFREMMINQDRWYYD